MRLLVILLLFSFNSSAQVFPFSFWKTSSSYCSGDADAATFITNSAITDAAIKTDICWLVDTLKSTGIWTKLKAWWPMVGGTATSNIADLKNSYPLSITGTITHDANGMTGNGSTGYANTGFNPTIGWSSNLGSLGIYSRTNQSTGTFTDMGASPGGYNANTSIWMRFGDEFYGLVNDQALTPKVASSSTQGMYLASRTASSGASSCFIQRNTTQTTGFSSSSTRTNLNIYICAINEGGTAKNFTTRQYAGAFIGDALSTAEALTVEAIMRRFNTKRGRNV